MAAQSTDETLLALRAVRNWKWGTWTFYGEGVISADTERALFRRLVSQVGEETDGRGREAGR